MYLIRPAINGGEVQLLGALRASGALPVVVEDDAVADELLGGEDAAAAPLARLGRVDRLGAADVEALDGQVLVEHTDRGTIPDIGKSRIYAPSVK